MKTCTNWVVLINGKRTVETHLWRGQVDGAIADEADWDVPHVKNFLDYLERHRCRIPDYQVMQSQHITIGSLCCRGDN